VAKHQETQDLAQVTPQINRDVVVARPYLSHDLRKLEPAAQAGMKRQAPCRSPPGGGIFNHVIHRRVVLEHRGGPRASQHVETLRLQVLAQGPQHGRGHDGVADMVAPD
jgi:hypothetical protein